MKKARREIIKNNQVSRMMTFTLGGYEQKVLLDGKSKDNPVVIFLHGGPGSPVPFCAGGRGMFPDFTDPFIMVYWDQLGCGINDYPIDDSFSIADYVNMTADLIKAVKAEFPDNRLYLFGTSWGSVLAAKVVLASPDTVDGVLVYGQVLKDLFFNDECFEAIQNAKLSAKDAKRLSALKGKGKYSEEDIKTMAALVRKHTEGYQAKSGKKLPLASIVRELLASPDYTFKDFKAVMKNGFMKNKSIWNELLELDMSDALSGIRTPYRILQGSTDIVTSTRNIADFVSSANNPNLSMRVIENNGHIPGVEGLNETLTECLKMTEAPSK